MMHRVLSDLAEAAALLTRLPVPAHRPRGAASAWAWPVIGAGLGLLAGLAGQAAMAAGLPPGVAAVCVLLVLVLTTGALHEDGLADTADGLFGARDPARRLAIMKDSRVGSFGVIALSLVTLARWSALAALAEGGGLLAACVAAGALSRAPMAAIMAALPNARGAGFSHATGRPPAGTAWACAGVAIAIGLVALGPVVAAVAMAGAVPAMLVAWTARARIGGQTGDILGAAQQVTEAAVLALAAAWTR
ncbi:MAG: adenosylcobinamide-GDP ribazoletransferase [Paracoccaceae bacterium]|nr:MAG: adenosylcobinamide-GDP ribazoletransferase [Paracoccaceae bacterium]